MELLFVVMGAIAFGLAPRYLLPHRDTYGNSLLSGVSVAVAAILWAGLTWVGWKFDDGWIWWVSLGGGLIAAFVTALVLAPRRRNQDQAMFERLLKA